MEPMQPSVQCGRSIRAIGVPYRTRSLLYSQSSRPQPRSPAISSIVAVSARCSSQPPPVSSPTRFS